MDILHKGLKILDYERGKMIGAILACVLVFGLYSCDVSIKSPISSDKVTRPEFKLEVMTEKNRINAELMKLEQDMKILAEKENLGDVEFTKWEEMRKKAFDLGAGLITTVASGGQVNTGQVVASLVGAGGILTTIGGLYDSKRKNKVIDKTKKSKGTEIPVNTET